MALKITPYLMLNGTAKDAIRFYEKVFGAQVLFLQTFGEMPENPQRPMPEEVKNRVSHASVKIGDSEMFFSDAYPGQDSQQGDQVTLCISSDDAARSKTMFEALQEGGQVAMPLQATFFSPAYGIVTDKFGITFQIHTDGGQPG